MRENQAPETKRENHARETTKKKRACQIMMKCILLCFKIFRLVFRVTQSPQREICCGLATSILVVGTVVTPLTFTRLRPKDPTVAATLVNIQNMDFKLCPPNLNLSLALYISIKNPNFGDFKNDDTTTFIYYRGDLVGQSPIEGGTVQARGTKNISTVATIQVQKLISNPYLLPDIVSGPLNLTSSMDMEGNAIVSKIFKLHASIHVACNISIYVLTGNSSSICAPKVTT